MTDLDSEKPKPSKLDKLSRDRESRWVKHVGVGEFKAQFSDLLREVIKGERVAIQYGRRKKTVALLVPPETTKPKPRKLGMLEGKASFRLLRSYEMTEEELLGE